MYRAIALFVAAFLWAIPAQAQPQCESGPVLMISASWCGYCRMARDYMNANNIDFQEVQTDTLPYFKRREIEDLARQVGFTGTVPFFIVGRRQWVGWSPVILRQVLCIK